MTFTSAGFQIGHATNTTYHTGCTVILCPPGTLGSVAALGPAPGSRELTLLSPDKPNETLNAVVLTGGSAYGLITADGVMRYLAERGIGHPTPIKPVPIVPAAVVYDLFFNGGEWTPDAAMGDAACEAARLDNDEQGNVGAGAGVTVGKWAGFDHFMKGGVGVASAREGDLIVGAVAVVNAVGDVVNEDGTVLAGARLADGRWAAGSNRWRHIDPALFEPPTRTNTTLVAIFSNARLTKPEAAMLAQRGHDGMAIAIRPAHTRHDGDVAFAMVSGQVETTYNLVANMAVVLVAEAIRNSVRHAETVGMIKGLAS